MTTRHRNGLCWLIGIGMTAALFAFVFLALDPKYAVNDDSGILRPFMGYETGEPAHFHIYIHGLLAWPLHWLGLAAPGVAWFSWMQLGFLFLASVVCQKSILQGFLRKNLPLWAGVLFALAFGFAFVLPYVARITFTQTAALLGAAAAMVFALLPEAFCARGGRIMMAVALVACVGLCAWQGALQIPSLLPDEEREAELGNPVEDLLEYALSDESMLIIHDNILAGDLRLFPDTSEGIPHNVSFWGGWGLRSGESIRQFANFGIDLLHFPPETFLRDDVLFAATVVDPPPKFMLNYLREKVDPNVDCMLYGENGFVYFFQFYIP